MTSSTHKNASSNISTDVDLGHKAGKTAYVTTTEVETTTLSESLDQRVLLKADIYVTVFMAFIYGVQFADKTMTSAATSLNLREDLDMVTGTGYSWVGSGFYLGYLVFEFPMSYILHKLPLARATAALIVCWGIVIACTAACQSLVSFLTCRVLLGAFESAVTPAFVVLTSQWYKRREHFARTCFWFAANGMGTILANSIGYGLLIRQQAHGLAISGWRIFYIIMGGVTIIAGVLFYFHMPSTPEDAWFLNEEEKACQVERTRENKQIYGSRQIKWYQIWDAATDPLTWMYSAAALLGNIPNGGLTTFMNLILQGMHYNSNQSLLMGLPSGAAEVVGLTAVAIVSTYFGRNHRMVWACLSAAVAVVCLCLVAWGPNRGAQLTGLYLNSGLSPVSFVGLLACIESNTGGYTKKLTTSALLLICYCVGNVVGPQTFQSSQQPYYRTGKVVMAVCAVCDFAIVCLIFLYYIWQNRRRNRKNKHLSPGLTIAEIIDLTDRENPEFRYAL